MTRAPLFFLAVALSGCVLQSNEPKPDAAAATARDVARYEEQRRSLEVERVELAGKKATEMIGAGTRIYWLEFNALAPSLRSHDVATETRVNYTFGIGSDAYNFRASADVVATAVREGDRVVYRAYHAVLPNSAIGELSVPAPKGEAKWHAYAVAGKAVYIAEVGESATRLLEWTPPERDPVTLFTLEEAGVGRGELWDLGVEDDNAVVIEAGRAWLVDLRGKRARALGNETEARGAHLDRNGVLLSTATGPIFHSLTGAEPLDVKSAIAASKFQLSPTFKDGHHFVQEAAPKRLSSRIAYVAQTGLFTFDTATNEVKPLLLDARDNSVLYRHPVVLDDGTVFVQGLASTSGATGADGPLYRLKTKL